jgi:prepilin-type processing-associated H-X9-DG protein
MAKYEEVKPRLAVKVEPRPAKAGVGKTERGLISSWLVSSNEPGEAMIDSNAPIAELSPAMNAVAYISQGVAMIRPVMQIPKDMYLNALAAAERTKYMSNAKQVALAALMYSADNDDNLPGKGANINDLLNPYSKNQEIFSGFVYSFGGGNLAKVDNPATTELGYITLNGGRVVAYLDGHVKWVPDK